ncbi:MAG: hypothetical protein JW840_06430 [Candidatus Thermoplasmatota archaeon]|nr:hypothetical protein [Candidatus Thermoplasmatota archaeon]
MMSRKMNNYSLMRVSTVFVLTLALVVSGFSISFAPRTGAEPIENNPPYPPSNPNPANESFNVSITTDLSWEGGDPDWDNVTYDLFFGTTNPPEKMATNLTDTTYDPGALEYFTLYYWKIIATDNQSASTEGPVWQFTTMVQPNNPPNQPTNESPANESIGVSVDVTLSWVGGDPDEGDIVTYDVFFGNTTDPEKVASNQSATNFTVPETLENNTMYYWRIVAWDDQKASTAGDLWHFTTRSEEAIQVIITKPLEHKFYFNDQEQGLELARNTIVYGKITITAEVYGENPIERVEFWADDKLLENVTAEPYSYVWQPVIQFNSAGSLTRKIKVIAYDTEGNSSSAELNITKWRFHILPWVLAGMALASRLVLHTKVSGLFFNMKESRISVSFYALRARFKTIGPFKTQKGTINFKSCTGGMIIGPTTLTRFGPLHKFSTGSFTFLGNLHADKIGFGQALLSGFLQRRVGNDGGGLLNLFRMVRS